MKKTTTKSKSPAPATRTTKTAKKKSPAAAPVAPVPAPEAPALRASAPATVNGQPKAIAATAVQTKIVAKIDVGYGNTLFVRGDGPGLSWGQGVPMECVASDQWELTLGESARPVSFKILLNDTTWCTGPDSLVASGSTAIITPEFC